MDFNSFGPGGEALSGLFMGQQEADRAAAANVERQRAAMDMANTQQIMRQREMDNQFESAVLGDKIQAFKDQVANKRDEASYEKFMRGSQSMGKLGTMLENIPPVARPAALKQMAGQMGIGDDNPMLSHLLEMDPNELPATLGTYSQKLYEQGDAARLRKQQDDAAMSREELQRTTQREIAAGNNATTLQAARIGADARLGAASARGAGGAPYKESPDQAMARMAREKVESGEWNPEEAIQFLQRYQFNKNTLRVPDTAPQVMQGGTPTTPAARTEAAVANALPQKGAPAPAAQAAPDIATAVKKAGQNYEPDKYDYRVTPDGRVQRRAKQ